MFDIEVIAYGILTIVAVVASILALKKPKKKSFEKWFVEVEKLFYKYEYPISYVEGLNQRKWKEWFNEGATPLEAFTYYFD